MQLGARQKKQTARETDAELRRRARIHLSSLRTQLKSAKLERAAKLAAVSSSCRQQRKAISARAKAARSRLNASIARTRDRARTVCSSARGEAYSSTLRQIEKAAAALNSELATQASLRIWAKPARAKPGPSPRVRSRERAEESDDEVESNISDPGLLIVWRAMRGKIRAGKHRSRTEAFFEWAAEHPARVYELQEADAVQAIAELEREERKLAGALRKGSARKVRELLSAVPF